MPALQRKFSLSIPLFLASALILAILPGCQKTPPPEQPSAERGKYLVTLMSCNDCHSPKVMDPKLGPVPDTTRLLSGQPHDAPYPTWSPEDMAKRNIATSTNGHFTAWAGPWGVSFTANLTPDKETGLGEWTEEAFIQAIRTGKHQGQPNGREILPPMPWPMFRQATDLDLKSIWAYLKTLPPVKNQVPLPIPPAQPEGTPGK